MKYFSKLLQLVLSLLVLGLFLASCSNDDGDDGNNAVATEITATAYTGTFTIGGTAYKTLKMASDNTYHIKGDNVEDTGTYALSSGSRSIANGTYIFYSKTNNGKTFYVIVSDSGIVLESGSLDASGSGTVRTSSEESCGDDENNKTKENPSDSSSSDNEQNDEETTVDFSNASSYTVTASEFADKVSEIREKGLAKAVFIITDATNDNVSELRSSITSRSFSVKLDLSQSSELTDLPEKAFYNAKSLYYITLPSSLLKIGRQSFSKCENLHDITIPASVTYIDFMAFAECENLESIDIPDSVTEMANSVFADCSKLTRINIGVGLERIGFTQNTEGGSISLVEINVAEGNPNFASLDGVLYNKNITKLIAFPCGKSSVTIPDTVTSFAEGAFWNAVALETLDIPDSVTQTGGGMPTYATKLTSLTIGKGLTSFSLDDCPNVTSITISEENKYLKFENGVVYSQVFKFDPSYGQVPDYLILDYACKDITELTIPDSVKDIETSALDGCTKLSSLTIGKGLSEIGSWLTSPLLRMGDKASLKSITIPETVTKIIANGFSDFISITFEDTESIWYITSSSTYTDGTEIGHMSSDPAENASKIRESIAKIRENSIYLTGYYLYNSKMVE